MGYTRKTWDIIKPHLKPGMYVLDLGSQNDFTKTDYPFTRQYYESNGIHYDCIDVNGKGKSIYIDLGSPPWLDYSLEERYDLVVDAGTKEHVLSLRNAFAWHYELTKKGGLMYCENPKVGSWKDHGFHYFTMDFYHDYATKNNCQILSLEEHSCNTSNDGWEIICLMRKL